MRWGSMVTPPPTAKVINYKAKKEANGTSFGNIPQVGTISVLCHYKFCFPENSQVSQFISITGEENTYNAYSALPWEGGHYKGTFSYHYLDMWFTSAVSDLFTSINYEIFTSITYGIYLCIFFLLISHIVKEGDFISVRYAHSVKTIENPREYILLANFMVIWEMKDEKLYRGYQISQVV